MIGIGRYAGALLALGLSFAAAAEEFPTKPIRLIVPYPPGGSTDIMARVLQEPLGKLLGQPVVVENKPGAAGVIGVVEVARAKPDGYTLLFPNNGTVSIAPVLQKTADYDSTKAFAAVSLVSLAPLQLVVNASLPVDDLAGFVAYAKARPDGVFYASAGPGSLGHLSSELFASRAGLKMNHVPYKGQAPSTQAVVTGEVAMLLSTSSGQMNGFIKDGKLKLLGVSSREPSPLAPGTAPIGKTLPGYAVDVWFGILAPAGTPPDVIAKLNAALKTTLADADLRQRFFGFGVEATSSTPQALDAMIAAEGPEWQKVIAERGIKAE